VFSNGERKNIAFDAREGFVVLEKKRQKCERTSLIASCFLFFWVSGGHRPHLTAMPT
jgi:hypothetical protein